MWVFSSLVLSRQFKGHQQIVAQMVGLGYLEILS